MRLLSGSTVLDSLQPHRLGLQAPLSMGFPRQESWSGLAFPPPGELLEPGSPHLLHLLPWQVDVLSLAQPYRFIIVAVLVATRDMGDLSPPITDQTCSLCTGSAWSLNHRTGKEVPITDLL